MLDDKFREWLRNLIDVEHATTRLAIAKLGGPSQPELTRLISGAVPRGFHLETLETVAEILGYPAWIVLWAIDTGESLPVRLPAPSEQPERAKKRPALRTARKSP